MIQTTYALLEVQDPATDPNFIQLIENVTGAWQTYGLNTPINVIDVLHQVGFDEAVTCFYRATVPTQGLAQTIGVALCVPHLYGYLNVFPNDVNARYVLDYCALYLQYAGISGTRLDACGQPVTVSESPVTLAQIQNLANNVQALTSGLTLTDSVTSYRLIFENNGLITPAQVASILQGIPAGTRSVESDNAILDSAQSTINGISGYTGLNINNALSGNPDAFLNLMQNLQFDTTTGSIYYVVNMEAPGSAGTVVPNFYNQAASEIGTAIVSAADQVISNVGFSLGTVGGMLKQGIADYNAGLRKALGAKLARYQQFNAGLYPLDNQNPQWDADGQTVQNAALNAAAVDLRSSTFLSKFDTLHTGSLTPAEMVTAMQAVQADMVTARTTAAAPLLAAVTAAIDAVNNSTDTVNQVFAQYLV